MERAGPSVPQADVPVVQLSINSLRPMDYHVDLGTKLAELRRRGILVLGSGNVVHNLRRLNMRDPDGGEAWAHRFDDAAVQLMAEAPEDILKLMEHPDYALAVPTPDHFIPLLYLAGMAAAGGESADALIRGYSMGSLSMTCYGLCAGMKECAEGAGAPPIPSDIPPDQTNL